MKAVSVIVLLATNILHAQLQFSSDDLAAIESTTPLSADGLPVIGTFYSAANPQNPPAPADVLGWQAWDVGNLGGIEIYLLDDLDMSFGGGGFHAMDDPTPPGGDGYDGGYIFTNTYSGYPTNGLWLQINSVTNGVMGWTASLTIHTPRDDTNLTYDLLYTTSLDPPVDWRFLMRCTSTNVIASGLCEVQGFFALTRTNGDLTVSTNATAQELAQLLAPPWVTVTNATYTGALVARGTFAGGNGCGLPIDSGVILSSGQITNAIGPNDDDGWAAAGTSIDGINYTGPSDLGQPGDADLDNLTEGGPTYDAAVLEFDIISTNSFTLQFQYVFASEEYPEYIARYNDPMAIFVSTNFDGANWVNNITNDFAQVPGTTNLPVTVSTINGGCVDDGYGNYDLPTNAQYYVDNHDPNYSAATNAAPAPEFNIQYDGMTVLLRAQTFVSANVTNHVKIAIADYGDTIFDSAIFITAGQTRCN